jgi:hypothetical protein
MGNADWSLDLLEQDLAAGFALLGQVERSGGLAAGESRSLADGVLRCMNSALLKVAESVDAQARLRKELAQARDEFRQVQTSQCARILTLESEVSALRKALREERDRLRRGSVRHAAQVTAQSPSEEHVRRPLVLRSQQGDFLGVTDRQGQALSLAGFQRLVEGVHLSGGTFACRSKRVVASCWEPANGGWCLTLSILGPQTRKCYALETSLLRTPSGNLVTLLSGMWVDGSRVPQDFVVQMFRQLRDSFQEE